MNAVKSLLRCMVVASLAVTSTQAASLTLATTSTGSLGQSSLSYAPRYTAAGLGLSLGSINASTYTPPSAPASVTQPAPPASKFAPPASAFAVAPAPSFAPMIMSAPAPAAPPPAAMMARQAAPIGQATADAFLNMGTGPYAAASAVTSGGGQAWWTSPQIVGLFGGVPNDQARGLFVESVRDRVLQTFNGSGIPLNLTTDPGAPAAHSLSVVSGTVSPLLPTAVGMTVIGGDGFTFIDQAAKSASNVDQLSWIVAHNVAHELMLAFGVPEVNDTTGNFIDARNANWAMMTNPNARFSDSAVRDLLARDFKARGDMLGLAPQLIEPAPVPEPATIALWGLAGAIALVQVRRNRRAA